MQRLVGFSFLLMLLAMPAMAQDPPANKTQDTSATKTAPLPATPSVSKIPTTEISGGFTLHQYYEPRGNTINMIGGYGDVEHNIIQRWLGAELQASGGYYNQGAQGKLSIYTLMAGPTFYPLGHRKITVFGHILAGEGYYRNSIPATTGFPAQVTTHTSFAWMGGVGLDIRVTRHLAVRLVQFDYAATKFFGGTVHESDTRVSVGIVYRFGGK